MTIIESGTGKPVNYRGQIGGKMYFPPNSNFEDKDIRKTFPPRKRKSYLNYLLIVCGGNKKELAQCLCLYTLDILNGPWKEAEPHIFEHHGTKHLYDSRIQNTWRRWNIFYLPYGIKPAYGWRIRKIM